MKMHTCVWIAALAMFLLGCTTNRYPVDTASNQRERVEANKPVTKDSVAGQLIQAAQNGRVSDVRALLGKGAAVDAREDGGRTPLMLAAARGHVARQIPV